MTASHENGDLAEKFISEISLFKDEKAKLQIKTL